MPFVLDTTVPSALMRSEPAVVATMDAGVAALPEEGVVVFMRRAWRKKLVDLEGWRADRAQAKALGFRFNENED